MKITQQAMIKQTQAPLPFLIKSVGILQLNRVDLSHYISNYMSENPLMTFANDDALMFGSESGAEGINLDEINASTQTLFDFITEQVELFYRQTPLRDMTMWWIEQLDTNGYVTKTLEEAVQITGESDYMVLDGLTLLQQLDPPGIGARDLRENLMLQTERLDSAPNLAYIILEENFDRLVNRQWSDLATIYGTDLSDIRAIFKFIQTLSPIPANLYQAPQTEMIYPELEVTVTNQQLTISETRFQTPLLTFDQAYYDELAQIDKPSIQDYIKAKKQEFDQLQQALQKRKETILRVGTAILSHQKDYFLTENASLQPLQINDLVKQLQLHESTISRAIRGTYVQTNRGVIELKSLLSKRSVVKDTSQDAIFTALSDLIEGEDKTHPLSDQQLADTLKQTKHIALSRRTIAKYRSQLGIPSTRKRKIR